MIQCLVCHASIPAFEPYGLPPRPGRCAKCGGKIRHREMAWFLERVVKPTQGAEILEVGPSKVTTSYLVKKDLLGDARYTGIDLRELAHHKKLKPPHRFVHGSVTDLPFPAHGFDFIFFNHVLPYIEDHRKALAETFRCLKPAGLAMINVGFLSPHTTPIAELREKNPALYTDEYLIENGTVWSYGPDFFDLLRSAGFHVGLLRLKDQVNEKIFREQLFRADDEFFLCFKNEEAKLSFSRALPKPLREV